MSRPDHGESSANAVPHRLPTVSASAALRKASAVNNTIPTGSVQVNSLLAGGLTRGKVTEVHGPPGSGKTSFAISAAANVLQHSGSVVWLDCGYRVRFARLEQAIRGPRNSLDKRPNEGQSKPGPFHHYQISFLANLIVLLQSPPTTFPPPGVRLLVLDSLSTLYTSAFPSNYYPPSGTNGKGTQQQWVASRRWALQRDVVSMLNKLAAVHDMAILVTNQMATRFDNDAPGPTKPKAMLRPSMNTKSWTDGLYARVLLFRHWGPRQISANDGHSAGLAPGSQDAQVQCVNRYAGLMKLGSLQYEICGQYVPFAVVETGISDTQTTGMQDTRLDSVRTAPTTTMEATGISKRRLGQMTGAESDREADDSNVFPHADADEQQGPGVALSEEEQAMLEMELDSIDAEFP